MSHDYYDNFANTPFDLNHDGHINPGEASFIQDTLYPEDNSYDSYKSSCFDDEDDCDGYYPSPQQKAESAERIRRLEESIKREKQKKNSIALGIFFVACIVFASSPGIALFIGAMMLSAKISKIF